MGAKLRKVKTGYEKFITAWKKYNFAMVDYVVNVSSTPEAMWMAIMLILLPEIFPATLLTVQFISGTVIQLLFLFLILIAQSRADKKNMAREIKDHYSIALILKRLDEIEKKIT